MSFQDIGRRGGGPSPYHPRRGDNDHINSNHNTATTAAARYSNSGLSNSGAGIGHVGMTATVQPMIMNHGENNEYSAISQAILQYQQNVNLFSDIIQSIGTTTTRSAYDTQILTQQYTLQTDVIQQLSSKIQLQLDQLEKQKLSSQQQQQRQQHSRYNHHNNNNNDNQLLQLQKDRATHLKLTRDYKWVETKYKNLQLDARRKWNMVQMEKQRIAEEEQRKNLEDDLDHDTAQLQMQLRDDRIVEEIMREREEEVRNINRGMHQVNEIYKDLANIVSLQQEQIDEVENTMEQANKSAESGLKQIEKAHAKAMEGKCTIS